MTAKRRTARKLRGHGHRLEVTDLALFVARDIPALAKQIGQPLLTKSDALAACLNHAFSAAWADERFARGKTPVAELANALEAVDKAARELLLTLGIDTEPRELAGETYTGVIAKSTLLRELLMRAPGAEIDESLLSRDVVRDATQRRIYAASTIVNTVRGVGFLAAAARHARTELPANPPRGPRESVFADRLFPALARVHRDSFGHWPTVERFPSGNADGDLIRGGQALEWLRAVIERAHDRLKSGTSDSELLVVIDGLKNNTDETLGRKFETAIARVKPGKRWLHKVMGPMGQKPVL
jgi:hypothetical protein